MQNQGTPKDFFMHLGATVALYVSAIALINLGFSVVNYFNPDDLSGYFTPSSVAWPISVLIVLVPILYVLEWLIAKDARLNPKKAESWISRWRVYLTLFLTGATVVGDIIVLINTYLSGEITIRLVYKILVVLIVAGAIFKYYILERLEKVTNRRTYQTLIAWVGIVIVLAGIVGGFMAVGSPAKQRALKYDSQRIGDLITIQWQILNYWQQKGKLPVSLDELADPISGFVLPIDPKTKEAYGYNPKDMNTFEICSSFALPYEDTRGRGSFPSLDYSYPYPGSTMSDNWKHEVGPTCFERDIDPEIYPVNPKVPKM